MESERKRSGLKRQFSCKLGARLEKRSISVERELYWLASFFRKGKQGVKEIYVGKQTNTLVSVVWLDGIAKPEIVAEVEKRISAIDIDAIIDS